MAWVLSDDAVRDRLARMAAPVFAQGRVLSVQFETARDFVAAVLPPGLEPAERPLASAWVGVWASSNCVGPFAGAGINLRARHHDLEGNYCLTMPMSTDRAIVFGRELYGEPKRLATIDLVEDGTQVVGRVIRHGVTVIELRVELTDEVAASAGEGTTFHYKFTPSCDGAGLDGDPRLIGVRTRSLPARAWRGSGSLTLRDSVFDPLGAIPMVRVLGAGFTHGETHTTARSLCTVEGRAFLPYAFAKMDDVLAEEAPAVPV